MGAGSSPMSPKEPTAGTVRGQKVVNRGRGRSASGGHGSIGGVSSATTDKLASVIAGAILLAVVAGVGILIVSMGGRAYHYVVDAQRLFVEEIEVTGAVALSPDEIIRLSGLHKRMPMLSIDLNAAAQRVMTHPRIASVVVERRLPRRIIIRVEERVPIGLVQEDGAIKGIDATGKIIPIIPAREDIKGPILTGSLKDMSPDLLKDALLALDLMRPDLVTRISELRMDPTGGVTLITTQTPMVIRLGRGDMPQKIERLRKALKMFDERGELKEYIDLRFRDMVTRP